MKTLNTLLILSVSIFTLNLQAQSIQPGLWKSNTKFQVNGISLPESTSEDCVHAEAAQDVKASIEKRLSEKDCSLTEWNVNGDQIQASLDCNNDQLKASGTLSGVFSATSYSLSGEAKGTYLRIPSKATVSLTGAWINACE